jgi:hypothetical protein
MRTRSQLSAVVLAVTLLSACAGPTNSGSNANASATSKHPPSVASPSPFESCAASAAPAAAASPVTATTSGLPSMIWVNAPLGVSLRSGPGQANQRLAVLSQSTAATVVSSSPDTTGQIWFQVQWNSLNGWVNGAFVVTSPARLIAGQGWGLMIPTSGEVTNSSGGALRVRLPDDPDLPFLQVSSGDAVIPPASELLTNIVPPVSQGQTTMTVWNYTVQVPISRVALNMCGVRNRNRVDGGWPWMYSIDVRSAVRAYHFVFLTGEPNAPLMLQVIASISLN